MPLSPTWLLSPSRVALPQQSPSLITHWVKERQSFLCVGRGRVSRFMLVCWRGDIHELVYFLGYLPCVLIPPSSRSLISLVSEMVSCSVIKMMRKVEKLDTKLRNIQIYLTVENIQICTQIPSPHPSCLSCAFNFFFDQNFTNKK